MLCTIKDQNCLDHGPDPSIRLRISRNLIHHLHHFPLEPDNIAGYYMTTTAGMLSARAAIVWTM
jgi:hypothetical protein